MHIWRKSIPGRGNSKHSVSEAGVCLHFKEERGGPWAGTGGQADWVLLGQGFHRSEGHKQGVRDLI